MSATVPPATATTTDEPGVKTFRGESLEELLPQIRDELGPDAVILRQRDGLKGGVGGFFQKRCVEVDARAGSKRIDTYAGAASDDDVRAALDEDASGADFADELDAELEAEEERFARPAAAAAPSPLAIAQAAQALVTGPQPDAPAMPPFQVGTTFTVGEPIAAADPNVAEGLESPAIRALFEAAAPFAEQLQMADAAIARPAAPAAVEAPAAPVEAPLPAPVAATEVEPVAPARPAQADTQEIALVEGGFSPALAADVVGETVSHLLPFGTPRQLKRLVRQALARRIPVQGPRALGGAALVLAGAGGSGKTLTVARLAAAYAQRSDLDVVVM
ncbi:MAG: hypothetical protein ACJ767_06520, partial [Chloroflexota bacterium]